jgi:hypothetical protein
MTATWIPNLLQSDQARGLSGDSATGVALDDANPYYNYRLRRQVADGDLVDAPALLWQSGPAGKRRGGLGPHITSEKGDGIAMFTDVLIILAQEDYMRAANAPNAWFARVSKTLHQEFEYFCAREDFALRSDYRQLGLRILCDGSADMGGQALGLKAGEFVTGLLPNLYTGPVRGSRPVIAVHVNIPGEWEGYREVGRLYSDQILFTLGNHWLDNFSHRMLREAAVYRLQQHTDGSFVHLVNPDLQDRFQVASTDQGGASVVTVATQDGEPLAHIVLELVEGQSEEALPQRSPGAAFDTESLDESTQTLPGRTVLPAAPTARILALQERGALLQKVHFGAFMEGYDVYLGVRGELGTAVEERAAAFQVRRKQVSVAAFVDGVLLGGYAVPAGTEVPIDGDTVVQVGTLRLEYRDLRHVEVEGWPYVGEIRRPTASSYVSWGETYKIGRSPECRVVLPDEPRNENIHWKASVVDGAMIRAKSGDIPKSRFYTDSIMVASEHAVLDLREDAASVECTARHCFVYVRRGSSVQPLYPTETGKMPIQTALEPGDEVLIGNCLFQVGFSPASAVPVAVAPPQPVPPRESALPEEDSAIPSLVSIFEEDASPDAVTAPRPLDPDATPPLPPERRRSRPADSLSPAALGILPPSAPGVHGWTPGTPQTGAAVEPPPPPADLLDEVVESPPIPMFDDETSPGARRPSFAVSVAPDAGWDDGYPAPSDAPPPPIVPRVIANESSPISTVVVDDRSVTETFAFDPPQRGGASPVAAPPPPSLPSLGAMPTLDFDPVPSPPFPSEAILDAPPPPPVVVAPPPAPIAGPRAFEAAPPPPLSAPAVAPPPPPPLSASAAVAAAPPPPVSAPSVDAAPPPPPVSAPSAVAAPPPPPLSAPSAVAAPPPPPVSATAAGAPASAERVPEANPVREEVHVVAIDEAEAQFELGRRTQLVQVGWMANGAMVCGNHSGADVVVPESRIDPDQSFAAADYFVLRVRGRRGSVEIISPSEMIVNGRDPSGAVYEDLDAMTLDVIRRDDRGEEDFAVRLTIGEDRSLPDPRARFIQVDLSDPLVGALFTRGLPIRAPRALTLGPLRANVFFDGSSATLSDYLTSYRNADGTFKAFFVRHGAGRFEMAPEDGSAVRLDIGDRLVCGTSVFELRSV